MKHLLIFGNPLILVIDIYIFNTILELIRLPSDLAVIAALILVCITAFLNYLLIKFIYKQFKKK
jgi:uncharacterized membrane protein